MKTKRQQKICYNCNGQVELEVIVCPYCGTDLLEEFATSESSQEEAEGSNKSLSLQQTLHSLYPPLYQNYEDPPEEKNREKLEEEESSEESGSVVFEILMGISLYLFGTLCLLYFFSTGGEIHIELNMKYLWILLTFTVPVFFWSWQRAK